MDGQDRGTKQVGVFSSLFSFKGGYLREAAKKSYFLNGSAFYNFLHFYTSLSLKMHYLLFTFPF